MVKFALKIKAKLNNLTSLQPSGGADNGIPYIFKLKCNKCQTDSPKDLCLRTTGPKSANYKCKECSAKGSVSLIIGYGQPYMANARFTTLMHFECNGFEPFDFTFNGNWSAKSVNNDEFYTFNFSTNEFTHSEDEYNMSILELESIFKYISA